MKNTKADRTDVKSNPKEKVKDDSGTWNCIYSSIQYKLVSVMRII